MALLTDKTDIIHVSVTSYSIITISLRVSSHCKNNSGRDLADMPVRNFSLQRQTFS